MKFAVKLFLNGGIAYSYITDGAYDDKTQLEEFYIDLLRFKQGEFLSPDNQSWRRLDKEGNTNYIDSVIIPVKSVVSVEISEIRDDS